MKKNIKLSIIVPVLNESKNIEALTVLIFKTIKKIGCNFELIFVDDNSTDDSLILLEKLSKKLKEVKFIQRDGHKSLSRSVIEGFNVSSGDYVIVMDGDLQHDPKYIHCLLKNCYSNSDICIASRYIKGGTGFSKGSIREIVSLTITYLTKNLLRIPIQDPMSGYFIIKRQTFKKVLPKLSGVGFKILLEIIYFAKEKKISEVPLNFNIRSDGKSKASLKIFYYFICQILTLVFRLRSIEFTSFCLVGGFGVLVAISLINILYFFIPNFTIVYIISFIFITTQNYFLNQSLTFNEFSDLPSYDIKKYLLYFLVNLINLMANTSIANFVFSQSNMLTLSTLFGIVIGVFWNFFTARLILKN